MTQPPAKTPRKAHNWARAEDEWYVEGEDCTAALLAVEPMDPALLYWDPACGGGNVVRALAAGGLEAIGTDLRRRINPSPRWFQGQVDFLAADPTALAGRRPKAIITNPPFGRGKLAEAFIRRALSLPTVEKVCAFVENRFLGGQGRALGLYTEHPPSRAYRVIPRPSCPPGEFLAAGNKASNGTSDFVWVVWDRHAPPAPGGLVLGYARRLPVSI